ncbi:MAG: hypothetical protein ACOZQL_32060 [Myxococcota bacterium]
MQPNNPAACPTSWGEGQALCNKPCTTAVTCSYPGAGDIATPDGCAATAVLSCSASADGGTNWTCGR